MRRVLYHAFFVFTLLALLSPVGVFADTLFVSPVTGTHAVGDTFSVRIMVSSPRQAINAISGVLSYPIDKLQVTSVSKIGSVLSLWVQEPSFSNSRGMVTFEGVVPNPGFQESNGRVLAVNFRVVGTGTGNIALTSGSLLANDGYGTNMLKSLGNASFNLTEGRVELPQTPPALLEEGDSDATGFDQPLNLGTIEKPEPKVSFEFNLPPFKTVADWLIKFFSIVIPLLALLFFLVHTTKRGVGNIRALRKNLRRDLHSIDRIVEKVLDIFKDDMTEIIHMLERARTKRKLTAEENAVIHRLRQNLVDSEKLIQAEIAHAEKDLDE